MPISKKTGATIQNRPLQLAAALGRIEELERENGRLRERARSLEFERHRISGTSFTDKQTGLKNEAALRKYLVEVFGILAEAGGVVAIIMFDFYDTEDPRDQYGGQDRDDMIGKAGALMQAAVPREAQLFRAGETSIALIVFDCGESDAAKLAQSVIAKLEKSAILEKFIDTCAALDSLSDWAANFGDFDETAQVLVADLKTRISLGRAAGKNRILLPGSAADTAVSSGLPIAYLVEPDAFNAAVISDLLKRHGVECVWFSDGASALKAMGERCPAVVISELSVPRLGGLDLRRAMKEEGIVSGLHNVPFIILTERKDDSSIRAASALGIRHYLHKPYFITELLAIVSGVIEDSADAASGAVG